MYGILCRVCVVASLPTSPVLVSSAARYTLPSGSTDVLIMTMYVHYSTRVHVLVQMIGSYADTGDMYSNTILR